ncbi:unnamed protein product [Caenorhabditis auriculariae]|uniref:Aromatic-L-amino-acid decarboxylase n=1 Tax=Caenorhabditis auriculariae TaxID=2777116 RepID=A0A8S1H4R0_9PELO|nr:unnamed protein product [Caenorhabditis auriculariae]
MPISRESILRCMDPEQFRKHGKEMVDFVANYWASLKDRNSGMTPLPDIRPGDVSKLVPSSPPKNPEDWKTIFEDLDKVVVNGATHWHHPRFFAYFPTACSYQAIMADILSGGIAGIGFTWKSCPSMTELEMSTLDWLVDLLGLPEHFKNAAEGPGCGIIQSTASDSTMIAIMAARAAAVEKVKQEPTFLNWMAATDLGKTIKGILGKVRQNTTEDEASGLPPPYYHDPTVFEKFVMYCSDQAHSSVEKDAMLCGVRMRKLKSSRDAELGNFSVSKETLEAAIKEDRARGYVPFLLVATVGTTCSCAVDHLDELGPICQQEGLWLHVDAAYAGSFFVCPEFGYMKRGMEYVDSFNYNAHKGMFINFDCSPLWFRDGAHASKFFNVDAVYLSHEHQATAYDYRHLQVALGRRFRSLKIWFVLRNMGIEKIREALRKQNELARLFSRLIVENGQFELFVPPHLGLVCFKIKNANNAQNEVLCNTLNEDRRIHLVPSNVHGTYFLRLAVCSQFTKEEDIIFARDVIYEINSKIRSQV